MDDKERLRLAKEALDSGSYDKETIEYIFPELRESEDDRIRKRIIDCLHGDVLEMSEIKEATIWLEKQGEQPQGKSALEAAKKEKVDNQNCVKPTDKVKPKFKVKYAGNKYNVLEVKDIAGVPFYGIEDEHNYIDYVLPNNCEIVSEQKPAWNEEDEMFVHGLIRGLTAKRDIHGHTTFSSDCIDITETINWLKSLKGRVGCKVNCTTKQEWSEEDEKYINDLTNYLVKYDDLKHKVSDVVNWLKSLRPQNRWKPSDEQMKALWEVYKGGEEQAALASLYSDLKRLLKI